LRNTGQLISSGMAYTLPDFQISTQVVGVKNQPHRFYKAQGHVLPKAGRVTAVEHYSLIRQKTYLVSSFPDFQCRLKGNKLLCKAQICPPGSSQSYLVRIEYQAGYTPKVFIEQPIIEYNPTIHLHDDNSLCLHHPSDLSWKPSTKIAEWIIPWIVEWLVFYEIWKLTGKWEGKEYIH
jgi:hypothetical protein